jgi:signal transduction histidine kinase
VSAPAEDADARAVRAVARRTGWQVAAVATAIVVGILGLAVLFVIDQSRRSELLERPRPGEDKIYVDANAVLVALVVLGLLAVIVVGVAAWWIGRRTVTPLGDALRIQRAFVADAGHELRTPLTVLDTRLQVLERRLDRGEPYRETLADVRRDARAMTDLVTDLLLVAEASGARAAERQEEGSDLRPVLLSTIRDLQVLADERGIVLRAAVDNEAQVRLSEVGLRRALVVLVDNAIGHSPDGAEIEVRATVERGRAVVRVRDHGEGITGVDPEQIFARFTRGAETGRRRGFGIGLSLVRDLAERAGGRVAVESTSPSGTVMRLELPVVG